MARAALAAGARPRGRAVRLGHLVAETARHAGHADILREQIDGSAGRFRDRDNLPEVDGDRWVAYLGRVQAAADAYR